MKTQAKEYKAESTRRIIAIISIVVTLLYLYWRVTETLNPNALVFSWALLGAEAFGALSTFLFFFTVWKLKKREAPPSIPGRTVDVFIPTKSESVDILRKTLLACNDLEYPHRTIVLDDGNRPNVKSLCDELNCVYIARPSHDHAKAGNLNFGLQYSKAEFIAVFDADHVPLPHFIDRLIGYFKDEKVAFVQVPQEYYNIDSFQHQTDRRQKKIWGEQYLFFSVIQPGRDYRNSAYFVGSCALIRRKALDDINGFQVGSITEDMLTSIRLHAKGWSSVYHNENLAYGLAAETLKPFHVQRQRWGIGSWQVFSMANPIFMRGLTFSQRITYLSSMIYPLEGLQKLIFYVTPPIALFTGVLPMRALDVNYLLHFIPYFAISIFAFNEMARGFGGQIMLEQYSMGKFITYLKSLISIILPKKFEEFKVTPKWEGKKAPISLIIPQILVFLGSIFAIVWALFGLLAGLRGDSFIVAVNCFWALYNSGLALAIIQYDYKKLFQRRKGFRIPDTVPVLYSQNTLEISQDNNKENSKYLAVADDITENGLSLIVIGSISSDKDITLQLLIPQINFTLKGQIVQTKSITVNKMQVLDLGVEFIDIPQDKKDKISRYLHESAVSKFMRDYSTRYKTYLEKRFMFKKYRDRAYRALTFLPVIAHYNSNKYTYAVIKDISESGLLLATRELIPEGAKVILDVIMGKYKLQLNGIVVRTFTHTDLKYPEHLQGVHFEKGFKERVRYILSVADKIGNFVLS